MSGLPASRASDFAQSLGVNTHIAWQNPGSAYADVDVVERSIAYLGVTHVRDGISYAGWTLPEYVAIAQTGVRFDISSSGPTVDIAGDLSQIDALARAVPGSVASVEGPNEFNNQYFVFNGQSSLGDPAWGALVDASLHAAVQADATLNGVPVIAASMSNAGPQQIAQEGDLSAVVDSSNWHIYYGNGDQPAAALAQYIAEARLTAPGKPVTITETGYYTAVDATDWGGGGVDQYVQAVQTLNALLDAYSDGAQTTYLYELLDNIANPASTDLEDSFGLFQADGTPKLAATAIHDLTSILSDTAAGAANFQTGTLGDSVTGLPATADTLTLEKSDGTYELAVWNEPPLWNEATKQQIAPTVSPIAVDLGAIYGTVNVYDPLLGTAPLETLHGVQTVSLDLSADPLIVEVEPNPTSTTYRPGSAGGTIVSTGADKVIVGTGAVDVTATGPTIAITGGAGALTYAGTAAAHIVGGAGALSLTLSGSGGTLLGGTGGMTVLDTAGGNRIVGAAGLFTAGIDVTTTLGNDIIRTGAGTIGNWIDLGSGSDTVVANGEDVITANAGNDTIRITGGVATVQAGSGTSSISTASGATDAIHLGSGVSSLVLHGTDTVQAGAGSATISAVAGSCSVAGAAGSIDFLERRATAFVTDGTGADQFVFTCGQSGGSLTIADFTPGVDQLVLNGYAGTGIRSEQVIGGNTQIVLTDNSHITLIGVIDQTFH